MKTNQAAMKPALTPKKNLDEDPLKSNTSLPNHEASPLPQAVVGATSTAAPWTAWSSAAPA